MNALFHFARRFISKSYGGDIASGHTALLNQISDFLRNH